MIGRIRYWIRQKGKNCTHCCLWCRYYGMCRSEVTGEEATEGMKNYRTDDESGNQEALFEWAAYNMVRFPELEYMYHVPNGGKRDKATAVALKRQGVKAGVPDIVLPVARGGWHGLYIELKVGKNKATDNQKRWIKFLAEQGYYTTVCYGWQQAAREIEEYMTADGIRNGSETGGRTW